MSSGWRRWTLHRWRLSWHTRESCVEAKYWKLESMCLHSRCFVCPLCCSDFVIRINFSWISLLYDIGTECCERLAFYGIAMNLVTYLTKELHQGNVSAATNSTIWRGSCYLTTLIGAFLADAYWGRYWTIAVFSIIYFVVSFTGVIISRPLLPIRMSFSII